MTRFASRADLHYLLSFVSAIVAIVAGTTLGYFVRNLVPSPDIVHSSAQQWSNFEMITNCVAMACFVLVYGAGFFALATILKRLGAQLRPSGIRLGAVIAAVVSAAIAFVSLTSYNPFTGIVGSYTLSPDLAVWADLLTFLALGGGYIFALFLALHYSKFRKSA